MGEGMSKKSMWEKQSEGHSTAFQGVNIPRDLLGCVRAAMCLVHVGSSNFGAGVQRHRV